MNFRTAWFALALVAVAALGRVGPNSLSAEDKKEPAKAGEFFNGKDTTGWEGIDEYWSVKDGAIVGASPKGLKFNTFLCSKKKYGDFEFQCEVRLKGGAGNSGVQVRSKIINPKTFAVGGPQADIGTGYWGSLY